MKRHWSSVTTTTSGPGLPRAAIAWPASSVVLRGKQAVGVFCKRSPWLHPRNPSCIIDQQPEEVPGCFEDELLMLVGEELG
jgi:hypothetical protein